MVHQPPRHSNRIVLTSPGSDVKVCVGTVTNVENVRALGLPTDQCKLCERRPPAILHESRDSSFYYYNRSDQFRCSDLTKFSKRSLCCMERRLQRLHCAN